MVYYGVLTSRGVWLSGSGSRADAILIAAQASDAGFLARELNESVMLVQLSDRPDRELMSL